MGQNQIQTKEQNEISFRDDFSSEKEYRTYLKSLSLKQLLFLQEKEQTKVKGKPKGGAYYTAIRRALILKKFPKRTTQEISTQTE